MNQFTFLTIFLYSSLIINYFIVPTFSGNKRVLFIYILQQKRILIYFRNKFIYTTNVQKHLSFTESPNKTTKKRDDRKSSTYSRDKRQESAERKMYTASSESELFECAILPIFHKLLTERHKSQPHGLNLNYGVSCPNISIKCDIVEYL